MKVKPYSRSKKTIGQRLLEFPDNQPVVMLTPAMYWSMPRLPWLLEYRNMVRGGIMNMWYNAGNITPAKTSAPYVTRAEVRAIRQDRCGD